MISGLSKFLHRLLGIVPPHILWAPLYRLQLLLGCFLFSLFNVAMTSVERLKTRDSLLAMPTCQVAWRGHRSSSASTLEPILLFLAFASTAHCAQAAAALLGDFPTSLCSQFAQTKLDRTDYAEITPAGGGQRHAKNICAFPRALPVELPSPN